MRRPALIVVVLLALVVLASGFFFRLPRPEIELAAETIFSIGPIDISNAVMTGWIVIALLIIVARLATRNMQEIPSGLQNLVEAGLEAFLGLVENVAGEKNGRRFFPIVATILIYVMMSNWFGLLPFVGTVGVFEAEVHGAVVREVGGGVKMIFPNPGEVEEGDAFVAADGTVVRPHEEKGGEEQKSSDGHATTDEEKADLLHLKDDEQVGIIKPFLRGVNTDLNATLAIAITAVFFVQVWGFGELGLRGYGSKFVNVGKLRQGKLFEGFIDVMVGGLEVISEFARIISFTFRLFGNIFAGEVLVLIITYLLPFLLILPFYGLELFVGFIQAFVFAMLTLVFGVMAVAGHGDHAEQAAHGEGAPSTGSGSQGGH